MGKRNYGGNVETDYKVPETFSQPPLTSTVETVSAVVVEEIIPAEEPVKKRGKSSEHNPHRGGE